MAVNSSFCKQIWEEFESQKKILGGVCSTGEFKLRIKIQGWRGWNGWFHPNNIHQKVWDLLWARSAKSEEYLLTIASKNKETGAKWLNVAHILLQYEKLNSFTLAFSVEMLRKHLRRFTALEKKYNSFENSGFSLFLVWERTSFEIHDGFPSWFGVYPGKISLNLN